MLIKGAAVYDRTLITYANREHPQWNHSGEVERSYTSTHADGQGVGVGVHVLGNIVHRLAHLQGCDTAAVFHNLC